LAALLAGLAAAALRRLLACASLSSHARSPG
jgi:hypothetical protein